MRKKVLSILMALLLVPTLPTNAVELTMRSKELLKKEKRPTKLSVYKGSCGENVKWTLYENTRTLIISGSGDMRNYADFTQTPWHMHRAYISTITIEKGVTSIGNNAFSSCPYLKTVNGCVGVSSIGRFAFSSCQALESFKMKPRLESIGEYAFSTCSKLKKLEFSNNVTNIDDAVFENCMSLQSVVIPDSVTKISDKMFYNCKSLSSVQIGSGVKCIGNSAFV